MSKRKFLQTFGDSQLNAKEDNIRFYCNPRKQLFGNTKQTDLNATATGSSSSSGVEYDQEWCEPIRRDEVSTDTFRDAYLDRKTCERTCHKQGQSVPLDLKNIIGNYLSETAIHDSYISDTFLDKTVLQFRKELKENFPYLIDFNRNDQRYKNYIMSQDLSDLETAQVFTKQVQWIQNQLAFALYLKKQDLIKNKLDVEQRQLDNVVEFYLKNDILVAQIFGIDLFTVYPHNNTFFLNELIYDIYVIIRYLMICIYNQKQIRNNDLKQMFANDMQRLNFSTQMVLALHDPNDYAFQSLVLDTTIQNLRSVKNEDESEFAVIIRTCYTSLHVSKLTLEEFESLLYRPAFTDALIIQRKHISISMFPWANLPDLNPLFVSIMFNVFIRLVQKKPFTKEERYTPISYLELLCYLDASQLERHEIIFSLLVEFYFLNPKARFESISWYYDRIETLLNTISPDLKFFYINIIRSIVYSGGRDLKFSKQDLRLIEKHRFYLKK